MILARENINYHWDGKRATMTAEELLREKTPHHRNRFAVLVMAVAVFCGLGVGKIALDDRISFKSAQLEELQSTALTLRKENDILQQKIFKDSKLEKTEQIAVLKLKMVKPELHQLMLSQNPVQGKNN